jgi:AraC-like DNA-binding protein
MATKTRYDDKFRANAVILLEAAGYPDKKGALSEVAKHVGVQPRVLSRWFNGEQNPPPDQTVNEKRIELKELLSKEIDAIFAAMPGARADASYRDLGTVAGILIDKKQLIEGKATERQAIVFDELTDEQLAQIAAGSSGSGTSETA